MHSQMTTVACGHPR